jgi:TPR repeat protein
MSLLLEAVEEAIRDLVAHGIYDVNVAEFESYLSSFFSWDTDFAVIDEKYLAIVLKAEELDAYRTSRREGRGQWVGGGFGIGGAVKGAMQAGAMNLATGALHGTFNLMAKGMTAVGDSMKKTALFADPATKTHLTDAVQQVVFNTHLALITALDDKKNLKGYVTEDDVAKAARLLENVANGRVPNDAARRVLIEAVHLNPYDESFYHLWLKLFGDQSGELDAIEEFFGVSVSTKSKKDLLSVRKASLDLSTPEACERSLVDMEAYALSIGYRGFADDKAEILALAKRLDQDRRTVAGVTYGSSQDAIAAQDEIARTVNGVVHSTHAKADAERAKKNVGIGLGTLIFLVPLIGAFFTLREGYSKQARLISFGWAAALLVFMQLAGQHDTTPKTVVTPDIATVSPAVVPPAASPPAATGQAAAIDHWTKLAEAGDADAQLSIGLSYANGSGVPKDAAKALGWFQKAAIQGHSRAQFFFGQVLATGDGISTDSAEGAKWYQKAAEQGEADAQFSLAELYKIGDGVPQDAAKADEWYHKAAAQGNANALAAINGNPK